MDNSNKLTPEEIAGRVCNGRMNVANLLHLSEYQDRTLNGTQLMLTADGMKQYAAQEISEMKAQRDAALDERDNARIMILSLQKERNEKDALLKEAIELISELYRGNVIGSLGGLLSVYSVKVKDFLIKTTGSEAGADGQ